MTKFVMMGDIHSNFQALMAIYGDVIENEGFNPNLDLFLSVGDLIGYGGRPHQVIDFMDIHLQ
ncbi:metallophosphoesterase, partial [Candidatus Woesearchaeota archaeon]|nr:metallophosphoesterase [Candidatus Woesearchaeota archaeon]